MSDYSFEEAYLSAESWKQQHSHFKDPLYGWYSACHNQFGYSTEAGLRRRYNRDLTKQIEGVKPKLTRKKNDALSPDKSRKTDREKASNKSKLEYYNHMELSEIRRTKYGTLEPTRYVSDLPHWQWLPYYLGQHRYRWDMQMHRDIQDMLWQGNEEVAHISRGYGKTTQYLGMTTREVLEIWEPHLTICSPKRPRILFRGMDANIVRNPKIRQHYGDILAVEDGRVQSNKSELMMWLNEELPYDFLDPIYRAASRETDIIGSRPSHIHVEDPTQLESANETSRLKEWYPEVVRPMLSLEKGLSARITATATRKGIDDFSYYLMDEQNFQEHHWKAILGILPSKEDVVFDLKGNVCYIEEDTIKRMNISNPYVDPLKLLDIYFKDPVSFYSNYQNEPVAREGLYFNKDDWHINSEHLTSEFAYKLWVDPARGKSAKSSDTAIIITAKIYNALVIVDLVTGKFSPNQMIDEMYALALKWHVQETRGEDNFAQLTATFDIDSVLYSLPGFSTFSQKVDKIDRIRHCKGGYNMARIQFHKDCRNLDKIDKQFYAFNQDPKGKWDILDIISTAYEIEIWDIIKEQMNNPTWGHLK